MTELEKIIKDSMKKFPCCVCGSPSDYFLKAKGDYVARAYCEKCSGKKTGKQN